MDRDKRWERIELAYDLLVKGEGKASQNLSNDIKAAYAEGITDEFMKPLVKVDESGDAIATIQEGDVVLCFNFRTDRPRQITTALTQSDFPEQEMTKMEVHYVSMTRYDESFKGIQVIFEKDDIQNTLGEVLAAAGKKQIRIAETEKYPHVTFFFNGGREAPFEGETRHIIASAQVATYDLKPAMSAEEITETITSELAKKEVDFVCLNFANTDMVGHTGVFEAAKQAAEVADGCTKKVVTAALENGYAALIIADHGNADKMQNPDGSPHTAHTTNLVPVFLIGTDMEGSISNGKLADVAPTILGIMGIDKPAAMTGKDLRMA
ncbi:MAG: 2,3-bisphosphoglycerate-independent phosphoglycerate mutase [Chitinophagales bacterium]